MSASAPCTVLIVDDDQSVRFTVSLILGKAGYRVLEAGGALDAVGIWNKHRAEIGLLLVDIMMPGINGPDLVRGLLPNRSMPVVFMSGLPIGQSRELVQDIPRATVQAKPFTSKELFEAVEQVSAGRSETETARSS